MNPFGLSPQQISKYVVSVDHSPARPGSKWAQQNMAMGKTARGTRRIRRATDVKRRRNSKYGNLMADVRAIFDPEPDLSTMQIFERLKSKYADQNPVWLRTTISQYRSKMKREK